MTSSGAPKQRTTRKLVKKRRDGSSPSATVPERPRKDAIDLDEDVLAPRTANAQFGNQSVFSMIAAVGSKTDFHAHLDDLSDSSDGDHAGPAHGAESPASLGMVAADAALSSDGTLGSGHQISRSLPSRSLRTDSRRRPLAEPVHHVLEYAMGESPAQRSSVDAEPRALPEFRTLDQDRREAVDRVRDAPLKPSTALPMRLKDIFELARPEEVVAGSGDQPKGGLERLADSRKQNIHVGSSRVSSYRAICMSRPDTSASTPISPGRRCVTTVLRRHDEDHHHAGRGSRLTAV